SAAALHQLPADMPDGAHGVEALRAHPAAVADAAAAEQAERIVQRRQAFGRGLVAAVDDEAPGLQQPRRADVLLRVPPPGRALRGAAAAEYALVQTVQPGALLRRL